MRLHLKILLILLATYVVFFAVVFLGGREIILGGFENLERNISAENVLRLMNSIRNEVENLNKTGADWAFWDDTYLFMKGTNPGFVDVNMVDSAFTNLEINYILLVDLKGELRLGRGFDYAEGKMTGNIPGWLLGLFEPGGYLMREGSRAEGAHGFVDGPDGLAIVTVRPILTSDAEGPGVGVLAMVRLADEAWLERTAHNVRLELSLWPPGGSDLPGDVRTAVVNLSMEAPVFVRAFSDDELGGYALVADMRGTPSGVIRATMTREFFGHGKRIFNIFMFVFSCAGFLMSLLVFLMIRRFFVSRLESVSGQMQHIRETGDLSARLAGKGNDEIAELSSDINLMLSSLEESSEARYRDLFENANDAIFIVGPDLNYVDVNRRAIELFGFTREDLLTMTILDIIPPEQVLESQQAFAMLHERGGYENFVGKMRCKNGTFRDIEVSSSAILKDGHVVGSRDIVRDITDRKRGEDALRESEERARLLFENNPDAAILFDAREATILDTNVAALRLFLKDRDEVIGKPFGSMLGGYPLEGIASILGVATFEDLSFSEVERTLKLADNSEIVVRIHGGRLKMRGTDEVYCVFKDVTNEVRLREMWQSSLKQLIQAEKLSFIGTLVSGFAHDINNPNQLIGGNVEMVRRIWTDLKDTLRDAGLTRRDLLAGGLPLDDALACIPDALRDIQLGADRIAAIIRNVTSLARTDTPELDDVVDVNEIVEAAVSILRHRIRQRTRNFEVVTRPSIPRIRGNRQKIEQVVINLVVNALEALEDQNALIKITTGFDDKQNEIQIIVEDEGPGMDEATLQCCQELFFTTKADTGGSGLGLAISNIFIREHGGKLSVETLEGRGCRASIRLPLETSAVPEGEP